MLIIIIVNANLTDNGNIRLGFELYECSYYVFQL